MTKLKLSRETLKQLDREDSAQVDGGWKGTIGQTGFYCTLLGRCEGNTWAFPCTSVVK